MTRGRSRSGAAGRPGGRRARAALGLLLAGILVAAGCGKKEQAGGKTSSPPVVTGVEVVTVAAEPRDRYAEVVGTVRAARVAAVAPQVAGRITALPVSEGSRVAAGALLAAIDDTALRAQAAAADGAVAEAKSAREESERAIAQAEAGRALAEKTHERFRALLEQKVVTRQEYEEVEARRTVADREHERALDRRTQAEARLRQAEANAEAARATLSYARITAPFAGIVTEKRADSGSMAVPGMPILVLEDTGRYRIEASIPERHLPALKPGTPIEVLLDSRAGTAIAARITEVVPVVDPASRTFTAKADLAAPGLRTGLFGRVRFRTGMEPVLSVPEQALLRIGGLDGLFVVTPDNTVRVVVVTTGERAGGRVEILSGLEPGARVAVAPHGGLVDGARVEAGR